MERKVGFPKQILSSHQKQQKPKWSMNIFQTCLELPGMKSHAFSHLPLSSNAAATLQSSLVPQGGGKPVAHQLHPAMTSVPLGCIFSPTQSSPWPWSPLITVLSFWFQHGDSKFCFLSESTCNTKSAAGEF